MPPPTTVLEYAENTLVATTAARAAAQTEAATAQTALGDARTDLEDATDALKETELDLAAKRFEIGEADTPAEAATLAAELAELVAEQRERQAALLAVREALADALSTSERASATLARLRTRLARAEADFAAAIRYDDTRSAIKAAAIAPPLDTIAADADEDLAGTDFSEVDTLITDAIPERLLAAARRGYELQNARLASAKDARRAAEDLLMEELQANGGVDGLVVRRQLELSRAERDLRDWAEGAWGAYRRASELLASLNTPVEVLSAAELAGVQGLDDTPGQNAADLRIALLDALEAVYAAELELEAATAAALAPDPAADDVSADPAVAAAQSALDTANATLGTAQTNYDAEAENLTAWSAEVPDAAWRKVMAFVDLDTTLRRIRDTEPADVTALIDAVDQAEANLAEALDAAEIHARAVTFLESYITLSEDREKLYASTHSERSFAALRGAN
jgi:hypothetical protein